MDRDYKVMIGVLGGFTGFSLGALCMSETATPAWWVAWYWFTGIGLTAVSALLLWMRK